MRLYSRNGAKSVSDPEYGYWGPDADDESRRPDAEGGFDFPDELSDRLVRFHHRGRPLWETEEQRSKRLLGEETARRRDPQTLYNAVEDIASITKQLAGIQLGNAQSPDVAAMKAEIEALREQLSKATGDATDAEGAKSSSSRRKPAAKQD